MTTMNVMKLIKAMRDRSDKAINSGVGAKRLFEGPVLGMAADALHGAHTPDATFDEVADHVLDYCSVIAAVIESFTEDRELKMKAARFVQPGDRAKLMGEMIAVGFELDVLLAVAEGSPEMKAALVKSCAN